jgi:hypothetical protein
MAWKDDNPEPAGPGALADVGRVRAILIEAARARVALTYAEVLDRLDLTFTRPRMRALCRTLDAVDEAARAAGEPDLAVLVVRRADRLPGQGWWTGGRPQAQGYDGPWTGPDALGFVRRNQALAFDHWAELHQA